MLILRTLGTVLFLVFLLGLALAQTPDGQPRATGGNIAGDEVATRFFVDLTDKVPIQTFYTDSPYRIIIDMGEVEFSLDKEEAFAPQGLINEVKAGRISKGRSRIVITLNQPAEIMRASLQKILDEEDFRFLMDLEATDSARFATLLNAQKLVLGESGSVAQKGDRVRPVEKTEGRYTIVIDPGHGGIDGGATGGLGTKEKELVLSFAKLLKGKVEETGPFDVLLSREDDTFLTLSQRLEFTRRSKADLFLSIHADSLRQKFVRGSTIYTLSKKASDRLSESLAESENSADLAAGLSLEDRSDAITNILIDLTTRETKRFSKQFSQHLVQNLGEEIKLNNNPQRSAAFVVLKSPDVPSVLLELGFLSNAEDEKLMRSDEWQQRAATAVSLSIQKFFEPRMQ